MKTTLAFVFLFSSSLFSTVSAAECGGTFSQSGAAFLGKSYKLQVETSSQPGPVFNGAYRAVVKEGWKVEQSDREAGVITALHSDYLSKGKRLPLSVTIEPTQTGSALTLQFTTPPGVFSAEGDVREGFCKIVEVATKTIPAPESAPSPQPPVAPARSVDRAISSNDGETGQQRIQPSRPATNRAAQPQSSPKATSKSDFSLKWTNQVGETIEVLEVTSDRPTVIRFVKVTYRALKPCFALTVGGSSYSKDGINLGPVMFKALNIRPGQRFRDEFPATFEAGHYVVLEKAYCEQL